MSDPSNRSDFGLHPSEFWSGSSACEPLEGEDYYNTHPPTDRPHDIALASCAPMTAAGTPEVRMPPREFETGPWRVLIPTGSFLAVVSDEIAKTDAILPFLVDAHAAAHPCSPQAVAIFSPDPAAGSRMQDGPVFRNGGERFYRGGGPGESVRGSVGHNSFRTNAHSSSTSPLSDIPNATFYEVGEVVGWYRSRKEHAETHGTEDLVPTLIVLHWMRDRRFFQETMISDLLTMDLARLKCSAVVVSRFMLDLTWAMRAYVDAVICCGLEVLKCIVHLYVQFGSVYHPESEFARLISRRECWTWIDNSKAFPAMLKPEGKRGMYDLGLIDSRLHLTPPSIPRLVFHSQAGLQRHDGRKALLEDVVRWHVNASRCLSGAPNAGGGEAEPLSVALQKEDVVGAARHIIDALLQGLLSPQEYTDFLSQSVGPWDSEKCRYSAPLWSTAFQDQGDAEE